MDREDTRAVFCLAWWQVSVPNLEGENCCLKMPLRGGQKILVWLANSMYTSHLACGGGAERGTSIRFGFRVFTQIKPVCKGDLGTRPKNPKSLCFGSYNTLFSGNFLLALSATSLEKLFYELH